MNAIDRQILEFCRDGFQPLKPLIGPIASGTVYRHARRLGALGWLRKEGALYRTTDAGRRELDAVSTRQPPDPLVALYPPLAQVPTVVHRALVALVLAAAVARRHEVHPDRHPFFVLFGATLRWKSSAGRFLCHALGLDPATHVVDCGTESGKSLSFRRDGTGAIVSRRALLDAPLLVLDEFLTADAAVRDALGIFLSGRLVMPVENETLTVRPVPVLTLNPRPKDTLEGRVGLSAPLIRRALLVDLDAVSLPDLAAVGEVAVEAARAHPPLVLSPPAADCHELHDAIVALTRAILVPAAQPRVDVEIVVNLATGMTAFIPNPVPAIAYVAQALGVLAETLGWVRAGWREVVAEFARDPRNPAAGLSALAPGAPSETPGAEIVKAPAPTPSISLTVPPPPPRRRTSVPDLDLSETLRARLIWFAMETQQDVEVALTTLLDFYLAWREADATDATIDTLAAILRLGAELARSGVDVATLHDYLTTLEALRKHGCDYGDVPEALRLIRLLEALPLTWDWGQAETAMNAVAVVLETGITLDNVQGFLERHDRLEALGFDEATVIAVVDALTRAGAVGDRREAVLDALIAIAGQHADVQALEAQRQVLQAEVAELTSSTCDETTRLEGLQAEATILEQDLAQRDEAKARLDEECERQAGGLAVVRALQAFLLGKTVEAEALWTALEALFLWRRNGGRVDGSVGALFTDGVKQKMVAFFQQLIRDAVAK
jgi:hypothetical protein